MLHLLEGRVHYFKFCLGDFSPIYLLVHCLHQYEPEDILDLGYNPILLYFVAQRVSALASGNSLSWLLCPCPFDVLPSICFSFLFIKNNLGGCTSFQSLQGVPGSSWVHHVYVLPQGLISHFPKESWLLLLENGIRNQNLGTRCAYCYWGNIALCPPSGDRAKTSYAHQILYIHIPTVLYVTISMYLN